MKFISSLELIESPVEKLALKGLPNEITALRSNLRTSVISVNKKMMNDIRDAEDDVQFNGQIKYSSDVSSQVKNVLTLNSCDLTVKKVIIPAEWEKKLAGSSSIDSNGLSESSRMAPGFTTHVINKVHLESKEKSAVLKEGSSLEIELKSKSVHPTMLDIRTSIPERSATETSNGQLGDVTNGSDEWSNEASKSAGEESLSINHSPHTLSTNVFSDCSAKMPLQTESCSPKNVDYDVEMDESSTYLGIHVKDVEKCDSQENELNDEAESTEKLNSAFEKEQLDTTFEDKLNNINNPDDQVSELDLAESCQENMLAYKNNMTTDIRVMPALQSKEQSGISPKSDDPNIVEENEEFEEKIEMFNFCDKLAANTMHNNTDEIQAGNDFSSISSDGGNSKLADIVDDLENMDSLHASNAEFDNTCEAVDQSDNLDELNSEYQIEEPDDDMSGLNDFMEASTENGSEIDIQDNVEDLENVEGNDNIDTAMDVDEEIENRNVELEIDKTDEHGDARIDELMDTEESVDKIDKVEHAETAVNEITELSDSEKVLYKTSELEETERDVDKSCEPLDESLDETSEPAASTEEMLDEIGDLEKSKRIVDDIYEFKDEVTPDTSSESANAEETNEISKPEESEKVVGETRELLNESPSGMADEPGECEASVNETNEPFDVAPLGKTVESSKVEETSNQDAEDSKQIGLIKADGCTDADTTLNTNGELVDEAASDKTNELSEAKAITDRTGESSDETTELTSTLSNKTDEPSNETTELTLTLSNKTDEPTNDEETLDETIKVVDEAMLGKTDKPGNVEAILDKPDDFMDKVALNKTDEPDDAEALIAKPNDSALNKTDKLDDAEATLDKSDDILDKVPLDKIDEIMDTEETSVESPKLAEGEVEEATEGARKEESVSEPKVAKTPKENKESSECESKDEAVREESVDEERALGVDSKPLLDSAAPEKCLESKPENVADVAVSADKLGVKRLASEEEVITEVKRTKIEKEKCTLVTEGSSNSETEGKEVNGEVFRTASKRLSEPIEVGEAKKPRLELGSEISDDGAANIDTVHDSDHSSQPDDKNKVESEIENKERVSSSDKVTDSTKEVVESSYADSKASSEAAPAEEDASESKKEKSDEAAASKTDAEPPKPAPPPKQMSNLDLAIERVVAAAAAAAEAAEAAQTTAIDVEDDDDDEVVETVPTKPSEPKKLYSLPFMDKLHSNVVKKMGRNELEEFVMQKVCEVLTERCQLGRLRQQVQALEEQNESWRKKTQMLQKQLKDLDLVMKRFVNDSRMKRDRPFPVKVTRSVGLQVHMPSNGPPQPGKQRSSGDNNTRNQATHRRRNRTSQNTSQPAQNAQQSQPATTTAATSSTTSTMTVQQQQPAPPQPQSQPQPQPPQMQASTVQQQQPALAQMVTTVPTQPVKTVQQNVRSPICNAVTVQKVVAPNLAKMGTTATIVNPRTSTSNLVNTVVKLPTSTKPVPIRPAITAVSTQNTITTVSSTAGSLSAGLRVASASQLNSRTIRPGVTATLCPVSKAGTDSKVIDLTDEDDKSKLNPFRFTTSSIATPVNSTVVTSATTGVPSAAIRVVHPHQLTGSTTTTILTTGNQQPQSRFAYLMPSTASTGQQRQVLIATSAAQVRPGIVTVSSRPTMSSTTFLLKNGPMLPIQQSTQAQAVSNAAAILRPASSIQQPGTLQTVRAGQPVRVSPSLVGRIPTTNMPTLAPALNRHPAPLPTQPMCQPSNPLWKCAPPKPELKTSRVNNNKQQGIVLSWNMQLTPEYEEIASYQLFAYQEGPAPPNTSLWKKVGDVKALPLPMACTLTQFMEGHKYHFAVRAVDVHSRVGPFSAPRNIVLTRK